MGFPKAGSPHLLRRRTVIFGWARNSACFASMAFGTFHGTRLRANISPAATFEACLPHMMVASGFGTYKGLASWNDGKLTE